MNLNKLAPLFSKVAAIPKTHASAIFMGAGVILFGVAIFEALKEGETITTTAKQLKNKEITVKQAVKQSGKSMLKVAVSMAASLGCFAGSKRADMKKISALTATAAMLSKDVRDLNIFKQEATKALGESTTKDIEAQVFNKTNKNLHATQNHKDIDQWDTGTGDTLYYYARHRYFFRTHPQHVRDAIKHFNEIINQVDDGFVYLNDINEWVIGETFPSDEDLGFDYMTDRSISLVQGMSIIHPKTGEAAVVFDYQTRPHHPDEMIKDWR